jgi:flagellar protein FliS
MPVANPWKSYKQISTHTAPPGQLVLMLYDAAIRSLERALPGFASKDPGERNLTIHNNLQRALDIVRELNNSLDTEAGGELADTLRSLYVYFEQRIQESNLKKRRDGVDEVIGHLVILRDAWAAMLANQGQPQPVADPEVWIRPDLRAA